MSFFFLFSCEKETDRASKNIVTLATNAAKFIGKNFGAIFTTYIIII